MSMESLARGPDAPGSLNETGLTACRTAIMDLRQLRRMRPWMEGCAWEQALLVSTIIVFIK